MCGHRFARAARNSISGWSTATLSLIETFRHQDDAPPGFSGFRQYSIMAAVDPAKSASATTLRRGTPDAPGQPTTAGVLLAE